LRARKHRDPDGRAASGRRTPASGRRIWGRALAFAALLAVALLVASELALPAIVRSRIEGRLTKDGGTATVSVSAQPALRLLFGDGHRLAVTGTGNTLHLPPLGATPKNDVLGKLDGFDQVAVHLRDLHAPPFQVRSVDLTRSAGSAVYRLRLDATADATGLGQYVAGDLGALAGGFLAPGAQLPVSGTFTLRSDHGRADVVGGSGEVAGIPVGSLGASIVAAIVDRL
jgi:hypothetical protein